MGAWSYEVLSNDRALDTMWDLVDSKNLKEDIIKFKRNNPIRKDIASYILNKDKINSDVYFGLLDSKFDITEIRNVVMSWQNKKIKERI